MRKLRALLVLNVKAMLSASVSLGSRRKKRRAVSGLGALVVLALLALYLSGTYSFLMVSQLAPVGMSYVVILVMPVLAVGMGTLFTVFASLGVVFGGKDNDLMLSLPVSAFSLMLSRTLALYVENLVFSVFVMLPAGIAYLIGGGGSAAFLVVLLVCTLLVALLPTVLSLVIGFLVAWISGKLGSRRGLVTVLYLLFFAGVMALAMRMSFAVQDIIAYAAGIQEAFSGWGLPFLLVMRASCRGEVLSLLALAALCILPFLLVVWLFGTQYKKIVTAMASKGARSDFKLGRVAASGCRRALLKKELRRFFGSPMYFLNTGIGLIMLLVAGVASLFFGSAVREALLGLKQMGVELPVAPLLALVMAVFAGMAPTTAVGISLEGKQLWILKCAPLSARSILTGKVLFQMLLAVPCVLVGGICLAVCFSLGVGQAALVLVAVLSVVLFMALLGLWINLCLPRLDAPNDAVVVKQSASVFVSMLASFAVAAAGAGLWWLGQKFLGADLALLVPAVVLLAAGGGVYALLRSHGERIFLEL